MSFIRSHFVHVVPDNYCVFYYVDVGVHFRDRRRREPVAKCAEIEKSRKKASGEGRKEKTLKWLKKRGDFLVGDGV